MCELSENHMCLYAVKPSQLKCVSRVIFEVKLLFEYLVSYMWTIWKSHVPLWKYFYMLVVLHMWNVCHMKTLYFCKIYCFGARRISQRYESHITSVIWFSLTAVHLCRCYLSSQDVCMCEVLPVCVAETLCFICGLMNPSQSEYCPLRKSTASLFTCWQRQGKNLPR